MRKKNGNLFRTKGLRKKTLIGIAQKHIRKPISVILESGRVSWGGCRPTTAQCPATIAVMDSQRGDLKQKLLRQVKCS